MSVSTKLFNMRQEAIEAFSTRVQSIPKFAYDKLPELNMMVEWVKRFMELAIDTTSDTEAVFFLGMAERAMMSIERVIEQAIHSTLLADETVKN